MNVTHDRAKSIFLTAAEIASPNERRAYIEAECAGDDSLHVEVDELLRHQQSLGSFLESPAAAVGVQHTVLFDEPIAERPGTVIGPYKLLQQIGEGGMGVVFMAEQTEPIQRSVALKIIKPGMDTRQVIARFEAERQAVAMMDHPNIAKVLDAGATEFGRPYFVMELVQGVPITEYCDQCNLTARERLELFVTVCQAVQHAHQKGVIHRDIKPTNVLVAMQDGKPASKIIDFGVAKAINQRLIEHTLTTAFAQMVGTPLYMSPEQAELSPLGVDTRSDIYSLGVLLYELLTGATPFDKYRLHSACYDELRRIIREEEPPRPSARISTLAADLATTAAERRRTDTRRLLHSVRGDLDWIVMKCLEKDRTRRYATASELAADVERYLENEPVLASPPSATYRLKKFVRRNKELLTIVGLLSLIVVTVAASIGWIVRDRTARQAALTADVQSAVDQAQLLRNQGLRREALDMARRAHGVASASGDDEGMLQSVRQLLADLEIVVRFEEIRVQAVQSVYTRREEELYLDAFRNFGVTFDQLMSGEATKRIAASDIRLELADGLDRWASSLRTNRVDRLEGLPGYADHQWRQLIKIARAVDPDPWRDRLRDVWEQDDRQAICDLADAADAGSLSAAQAQVLGNRLRSMGEHKRAVAVLRGAQRSNPTDFFLALDLALAEQSLGPAHFEKAIGFHQAAVAMHPRSATSHINLAGALQRHGKLDEAVHRALQQQGDRDGAIASYCKAIEINPNGQLWTVVAREWLTRMYIEASQWDEVIALLDATLELQPDDAFMWYQYAALLVYRENKEEYQRVCHEMLDRFGENTDARITELTARTCLLVPNAVSDLDRVQKLADRAAAAHEKQAGNSWLVIAKGMAEYRAGNYASAIQWLNRVQEGPLSTNRATANALLAMAHHRLDHPAEAEDAFARANATIVGNMPELNRSWHFNMGWPYSVHFRTLFLEAEELLGMRGQNRDDLYLQSLSEAIDLAPTDPALWAKRAHVYAGRKRYKEFISDMSQALSLKDDPQYYNELAWFFATFPEATLRDPQRAVESARKAAALKPDDQAILNTLGVAQYHNEDYSGAFYSLNKSLELNYHFGYVNYFFLAMAEWKLGNEDAARKWYEKGALYIERVDPTNEELIRLRAEAAEVLGLPRPEDNPRRNGAELKPTVTEANSQSAADRKPLTTND